MSGSVSIAYGIEAAFHLMTSRSIVLTIVEGALCLLFVYLYQRGKSIWRAAYDEALASSQRAIEDAPDNAVELCHRQNGFHFHFERIEDAWFLTHDSSRKGVRR
jgi:hypothetical protein